MNAATQDWYTTRKQGSSTHPTSRWYAQHAAEPDGSLVSALITYTCIACSKSLTIPYNARPEKVYALLSCHEQHCIHRTETPYQWVNPNAK